MTSQRDLQVCDHCFSSSRLHQGRILVTRKDTCSNRYICYLSAVSQRSTSKTNKTTAFGYVPHLTSNPASSPNLPISSTIIVLTFIRRTELLKDEFLTVPVRHITNTLKKQKTLYKAYGVIETQIANYQRIAKTYTKLNKPRNKRDIELKLIAQGSQLPKELHAAKKKSEVEAGK
jgi:hypothetical protein